MFKNKYVLKYHVEGAHNQTVGEPSPQLKRRLEKRSLNTVTCFCGISFETMNSYNEHMRTHQGAIGHHGAGQVQNEVRKIEPRILYPLGHRPGAQEIRTVQIAIDQDQMTD